MEIISAEFLQVLAWKQADSHIHLPQSAITSTHYSEAFFLHPTFGNKGKVIIFREIKS